MIKSNVYLLKIGDKWKIGKWTDIKKWINNEFKENSEELVLHGNQLVNVEKKLKFPIQEIIKEELTILNRDYEDIKYIFVVSLFFEI